MSSSKITLPQSADIVAFRDAAVLYAAARRAGGKLELSAPAEDRELLEWLGITELHGSASFSHIALPAWGDLPRPSLQSLRERGYVAEAVFAALVRSSYGPSTPEFYPTRSELGFLFEDSRILREARWDDEYLDAAQAFFMEELTPTELLEKSLAVLPAAQRQSLSGQAEHWQEELHAVTFLVCAGLENLCPLTALLGALLTPSHLPELSRLLEAVPSWSPEAWTAAWQRQESAAREKLTEQLCPGFPQQAEAILFTAGPALLRWRTGSISEALR